MGSVTISAAAMTYRNHKRGKDIPGQLLTVLELDPALGVTTSTSHVRERLFGVLREKRQHDEQ